MSSRIDIVVTLDLSQSAKEWIMSMLDDKLAGTKAESDSAIARVQADLTALKGQIADLSRQVANGATDAQLAILDEIKANFAALDPTNPAVIPTPVPAGP